MSSTGMDHAAPFVEQVVLVDENDRAIGTAEKLSAHRDGGRLHRAFSVFLFDDADHMLLQQRAATKYHFPLLWTNACCGHPRPGEDVLAAARRRVGEELGIDVELRPVLSFVYEAEDLPSGMTEREFDHVLVGRIRRALAPSPDEIAAVDWRDPGELLHDVAARPERYTPWFRRALDELELRGLLRSGNA